MQYGPFPISSQEWDHDGAIPFIFRVHYLMYCVYLRSSNVIYYCLGTFIAQKRCRSWRQTWIQIIKVIIKKQGSPDSSPRAESGVHPFFLPLFCHFPANRKCLTDALGGYLRCMEADVTSVHFGRPQKILRGTSSFFCKLEVPHKNLGEAFWGAWSCAWPLGASESLTEAFVRHFRSFRRHREVLWQTWMLSTRRLQAPSEHLQM